MNKPMKKEDAKLAAAIEKIWEIGVGMGLDPFPLRFEIVPAGIMYEFGAYGLPGRFSHWTHGKAYEQMKTMYDHGLSKIYELVINTDPSYAFLMEGNSLLQNKMVAAHVMGHADFFKNNVYFRNTSRSMLETVSVDASRIHHYEESLGRETVELFLDAVLAIQEHVDPGLAGRPGSLHRPLQVPAKDLLRFIAENAPDLEEWQRDIIWIVRQEMLYFLPQMQTKIMNEGWASYWHLRIMREMDLPSDEYLEFAQLHANIVAPLPGHRGINPYAVGLKIFEDIEKNCNKLGLDGRARIFEVRELEADQSFLRNHLNRNLVEELDLYSYELRDDEWIVADRNWEHVRDQLVDSMTNFGFPTIKALDADYNGRRELYLKHYFEGRELDFHYSERALRHVYTLWGRPVHLETVRQDRPIILSFDGEQNTAVELDTGEPADVETEPEPAA